MDLTASDSTLKIKQGNSAILRSAARFRRAKPDMLVGLLLVMPPSSLKYV
jgi:hypothetical protein